jgi:hypothetical protein
MSEIPSVSERFAAFMSQNSVSSEHGSATDQGECLGKENQEQLLITIFNLLNGLIIYPREQARVEDRELNPRYRRSSNQLAEFSLIGHKYFTREQMREDLGLDNFELLLSVERALGINIFNLADVNNTRSLIKNMWEALR